MTLESNTKTILLAHGSSDPDWCAAFVEMTQLSVESKTSVALAFMELSEPSLEEEVRNAKEQGYNQVKVLPLFLAEGRHLKKDVPGMLETYKERYQINTELLPPIGKHPILSEAINSIIDESV